MATENQTQARTKIASEAIAANLAVVFDGEDSAGLPADSTACNGFAGMGVASGEALPVNYAGAAKCVLGATLSAGAAVMANSAGKLIAAATAGNLQVGTLNTGGVLDDVAEVVIQFLTIHA